MAETRTIELEVKQIGLDVLRGQLKEAKANAKALAKEFGETSKEAQAAAQAAGLLENKITEVREASKSLKTQLKEAQLQVAVLSDKFGATSDQAIAAAKAAAILKDTIGDAKTLTDAFNPDAKFKALTGALSGAANGFQAVQGAMGLIGVESAAVEETLLRVQSAMAFAQGIDGVLESVDSFKTLAAMLGLTRKAKVLDSAATATQATVTTAATAATGKMTIAQRLLNLVMKANPIFLIIAGIAALTTAIILLNSETDNQAEKQKRLNKLNKEYREEIEKQIDLDKKKRIQKKGGLQDQQREIELLKAKGATDKEIYDAEKKLIKTQLNDLAYSLGYRGYLTKAEIQQKKDLNNSLEILDAEYSNNKADKEEENAEKRKQNQEKNNAEYLRKQQEDNEKLKKAEQDLTNEIIKIAQDWEDKQKTAREKRVEDAKTAEQDIYDNAIGYLEATLIADENNLQAKKDLLDVQRSLELQNAELTAGEIAAINAKYDKAQAEADKASVDAEVALANESRSKKLQMAASAFDALGSLAGAFSAKNETDARKQFKVQKAFNIASAITNTALAVTGALTAGGNPIKLATGMQFVEAGIAAVSGAAAVANIAKTQFNGGGTDTPAPPTGGGGAPMAPNFNIVGNSGINQLAELGGQPIQAYVVSGEVTSAQSLDRNRIQNATF